ASNLIRKGEVHADVVTLSFQHENSADAPFYDAVERHCQTRGIHVSTGVYPFLTETHTGGASPAFWEPLHAHNATIANQLDAKSYVTGLMGDLVMGNWWDDSEQVAKALRHGKIWRAVGESLEWSKVLRIPIYSVLWKALVAGLPTYLSRPHLTSCNSTSD